MRPTARQRFIHLLTHSSPKVTTPVGDVTELSQDFTLSEEGEGDNLSGNKELRKEADDEDETNSKRAKVPLQTPATE